MADQDTTKTYVRDTRTTETPGNSMALIVGGLVVAVGFILWLVFGGSGAPSNPGSSTTNVTIEPSGTPTETTTNVTVDPAAEETEPAAPAEPAPADDAAEPTAPAEPATNP